MTATARQAGLVALVLVDGSLEKSWKQAQTSAKGLRDFVESIELIPDAKLKAEAYDKVAPLVNGVPKNLLADLKKSEVGKVRVVRIEIPGGGKVLSLAEIQVFAGGKNIALRGVARQSSLDFGGDPVRAIDGITNGVYAKGSITHTQEELRPWWELDLGADVPIDSITIFNRTDGDLGKRLDGYSLILRDSMKREVFRRDLQPAPAVSATFTLGEDVEASIRRAAMRAVAVIPGHEAETAATLAKFIQNNDQRETAVRSIRRIPKNMWPREMVKPTLAAIVDVVAKLPPAERTEEAGIDLFLDGQRPDFAVTGGRRQGGPREVRRPRRSSRPDADRASQNDLRPLEVLRRGRQAGGIGVREPRPDAAQLRRRSAKHAGRDRHRRGGDGPGPDRPGKGLYS